MAFGFFKKDHKADLILYNGNIITCDFNLPHAEAVACFEGKIIATGDFQSMNSLIGSETRLIDLKGKFATPGLIDILTDHVMEIFSGHFADLKGLSTLDEITGKVSQWAHCHPDNDIIFGYGYSESAVSELLNGKGDESMEESPLSGGMSEEIMSLLDNISCDRPVVLLCESSVSCMLNHLAASIAEETAQEEQVSYITAPYILNLFIPFDFEHIETAVAKHISENLSRGITSELNKDCPDYFESLYSDSLLTMYHEGSLSQRFFGSYMMNRPLFPHGLVHRLMARKTMYTELDGMIHADMLYLDLNKKSCPVEFSQDALDAIILQVSERNFSVFFRAENKEDLDMTLSCLEYIRNKGCKNTIVISSEHIADKSRFVHADSAYYMPSKDKILSMDMENFLDVFTAAAADMIGASEYLGSIQKGKFADIAVFDRDPMSMTPSAFLGLPASMTIFNGKIICQNEEE